MNPRQTRRVALSSSSRPSGFTLIEMMVVLCILALLAGIAIPTYRQYVLRANRSEAQTLLRDAAAQQERYLAQYSKYTDTPAKLAFTYPLASDGKRYSTRQLYQLAIEYVDGNTRSYRLSAMRHGVQQSDSECGDFTLDHQGQRGTSAGSVDSCWR
ncbi:type IV pilin protein [Pseudomonas sp. GD04087]|uniref:type IV pilin protein n=1 Tax=unclassified Pseudomonas TaxID=196821 RepID=UPI00244C90C5|nr:MULTISPECIES: type IV pilin protein [unclassified Pseudomonas]MDH0291951.1 type IV pilin protein [Pseudomonas sp. GD04087]MDH1049148.1 type IV pilin protein [Pseudomonas sp. GD03903]MDH1999636.1 type IV pilin protein [Pseudomonas sp. GD03691]